MRMVLTNIIKIWYIRNVEHNYNSVVQKYNITVTVSEEELAAIDRYLQPLCGKRGPFIRKIILEKVGYQSEKKT